MLPGNHLTDEDSPTYTILSKVSAAAPPTGKTKAASSVDANLRHVMREEQDRFQLEGLAMRGNDSPYDDYDDSDGGPVDPPEETSQFQAKVNGGGSGRGVDPDTREDALEPDALDPDALETSLK